MITTRKSAVRTVLERNDLDAVAAMAATDRKVLSVLVRMAYDKETLIGWRAIKAIGLAAREIIKTDYDFLRETCRKLLWSLSDESGGIGWAAPEILGEIVSADPERFSDIIPLLAEIFDIEEKVFRPGVVYALSRIAESAPEKVLPYEDLIIDALKDENPLTQVYALELAGRLWKKAVSDRSDTVFKRNSIIIEIIASMKNSKKVAWVYRNKDFICLDVGEISENILKFVNIMKK